MTPAEERAWIEHCSEAAREMSSDGLLGLFNSTLTMVHFASQVGGMVQVCPRSEIEFTILRTEMESRGLIRFH